MCVPTKGYDDGGNNQLGEHKNQRRPGLSFCFFISSGMAPGEFRKMIGFSRVTRPGRPAGRIISRDVKKKQRGSSQAGPGSVGKSHGSNLAGSESCSHLTDRNPVKYVVQFDWREAVRPAKGPGKKLGHGDQSTPPDCRTEPAERCVRSRPRAEESRDSTTYMLFTYYPSV